MKAGRKIVLSDGCEHFCACAIAPKVGTYHYCYVHAKSLAVSGVGEEVEA